MQMKRISATGLLTAALVATPLSFAGEVNALAADAETVTVMKVDHRGKPPFKRRFVTMSVADAAMAEVTDGASPESQETVTVTVVDTRGKPPFTRRKVEVPVTDAAMAEPAEAEKAEPRPPRRNRPPFLRHTD